MIAEVSQNEMHPVDFNRGEHNSVRIRRRAAKTRPDGGGRAPETRSSAATEGLMKSLGAAAP